MLLDDITFRNRNKEYGAFLIKKKYRKTVIISLIISTIIVLSLVTVQFFIDFKKRKNEKLLIPPKIIVAELIKLDIEQLKPKAAPLVIKEQEKQAIPEIRKDSTPIADTIKAKVDTLHAKNKEEAIKTNEPELYDDAKFVCGGNMLEFRMWFMQNFNYPDNPNIRKNEGRILLNFIVNTKGLIDSAWVITGIDPIIDAEAKRILFSSPRWKPCIIGGQPLKQLYQFPVYLVRRK